MTARSRLGLFLRTPRGVVALLGAALGVSALAASAVALNRSYFERFVRERYPPPAATLVDLGKTLRGFPGDADRVRRLTLAERKSLYTTWVQVGHEWSPAVPRVLVEADPELFLDAAFTTLVAGSPLQRRRAVELIGSSRDPSARALLQEALDSAKRRRESDLVAFIEATLWSLERRQQ